ncbi:amino acid ABC transporter substrate-binding protein [Bacillaceae bacterium CLA-AA-H227]|uniref:Amino acid ABC transporter substrate-binding protein n=2 Tax=Robertmurraya TaxID=2837507 RepID=A0A4U1CZ75_9BACI|nr:amino acid ABC transporter substrate-binding protein [Robertmurraya kyonggiensis]TKC15141.1 amino acid ABC transporter substrate-binding protein [Robertmurraya kyonggiensis]
MKKLKILSISLGISLIFAGCSNSPSSTKIEEKIIVGIDDKFAPMGFRDENNEIVGFDIDYAKAAGEKMGVEMEFLPIDWSSKESELNSGRIDLIWNGYTITDDRKQKVLFTKPYLKNAQVIVTKADSDLTKMNDLSGKVVGVQSLSSALDALNASPIKKEVKTVIEFKDNVLALSDLKIGRIDAVVIDQIVADYYLTSEKNTFEILEDSLAPEEYGIGVKKGNDELLNKLQIALDELNEEGTATEISKKWFGEDRILK